MTGEQPEQPSTFGGRDPATVAAAAVCDVTPTKCQARTRLYRHGNLEMSGFPVADISDYLQDPSSVVWLDLRIRTATISRCSASSSACTRWP